MKRVLPIVVVLCGAAVGLLMIRNAKSRDARVALDTAARGAAGHERTRSEPARASPTSVGTTQDRETAVSSRAASVSFAPAPNATSLPTDPQDPDYDPYVLMRALNVSSQSLFEKEKRDPLWAPAVEKRIGETLHGDFSKCFPNREVALSQECRSSTCVVTLSIPDDFSATEKEVARAIPQLARLASSIEPRTAGGTTTFAMTMARDRRDLDQFDAKMAEGRKKLLDSIREAKQPPPKTDPMTTAIVGCLKRIAESDRQ